MDQARLDRILSVVRKESGRLTTARRAVVTALVEGRGHLTAEDLTGLVRRDHPDVHRSTVYRTLDSLEAIGLVDHVHLGHGRAIYHLTDEPHQHLVCESCGAVVEVPDSVFEGLGTDLRRWYGFRIRPNHFAVLGRCELCDTSAGH